MSDFPDPTTLFSTDETWTAKAARTLFQDWFQATTSMPGAAASQTVTVGSGDDIVVTSAFLLVAPGDSSLLSSIRTDNIHNGAVVYLSLADPAYPVLFQSGGNIYTEVPALIYDYWIMLRLDGTVWKQVKLGGDVSASRKFIAMAPLFGGGDLSADRIISIAPATPATAVTDGESGSVVYARDNDTTSRQKAATPAGVASQILAGAAAYGGTVQSVNGVLPDGDKNVQLVFFVTQAEFTDMEAAGTLVPGGRYIIMDSPAVKEDGYALLDIKPNIKGVVDSGFLSVCVDNGELLSEAFLEASNLIKKLKTAGGNVVSMEEYVAEQAAQNGVCARFALSEDGTKFRIPCAPGLFWRGLSVTNGLDVGMWKPDQMRPITGSFEINTGGATPIATQSFTGAFTAALTNVVSAASPSNTTAGQMRGVKINTALLGNVFNGSETAPVHAVCDYQMKMYGTVTDIGTANLSTIITDWVKLRDSVVMPGKIELLPFRYNELPPGWHFCNGDFYPRSSEIGMALEDLPDNYKLDWNIVLSGGNVSIPNLFYIDGRGVFLRAVGGTTRQVGVWEWDEFRSHTHISPTTLVTARFTTGGTGSAHDRGGGTTTTQASGGDETRPLNRGMTPAIFLGV